MGKALIAIFAVVIIIVLAIWAPSVIPATKSFRTDIKSQSFTVATVVGATAANVSLSNTLWNEDVAEVTSLVSTVVGDAPVATSYNGTGNKLLVTGLSENATRTVTVGYRTSGLAAYAGADEAATKFPTIVIAVIILVPLAFLAALFIASRGR